MRLQIEIQVKVTALDFRLRQLGLYCKDQCHLKITSDSGWCKIITRNLQDSLLYLLKTLRYRSVCLLFQQTETHRNDSIHVSTIY
jgi:hypothetical protein